MRSNKFTEQWVESQLAACQLCHFHCITLNNLANLNWASLSFTSVKGEQLLPCLYVKWLSWDLKELMLVKKLPPPLWERGRDCYVQLPAICHTRFPGFFINGITLFFSLISMHNKMGKYVNSLWFFYLGEDFKMPLISISALGMTSCFSE